MAFIGFAAKVKKLAISKYTDYKSQKAADKALYKEVYEVERKRQIKLNAKAKARKIGAEARLDAKHGGKFKRFVVESIKKSKSNKNNPWTSSPKKGTKNPWLN